MADETAIIDEIKKQRKKGTLSKEDINEINKYLFKNVIIAACIIIYFMFLNLGKINIKADVYIVDLKVFSVSILLSAIAIIEQAYKKDSGTIAIYGIEMIVLSLITLALIYIDLLIPQVYIYIVLAISYIFAIYYLIKSIVIYITMKKKYSVEHIKEIMNKDE